MNRRFAVIGFGAITAEIVRTLEKLDWLGSLVAVLLRAERLGEAQRQAARRFDVVDTLESACELEPDIVAECASGHSGR